MKSRLFSNLHADLRATDDFQRDLQQVFDLTPETRKQCVAALPSIVLAETNQQERRVLNHLIEHSSDPAAAVIAAVDSLKFLVTSLASANYASDSADDLARDLIELRLQPSGATEEHVKQLFSELIATARDVAPAVRARQAVGGPLPAFKGVASSVELRAIQRIPYDAASDVDLYRPEIERFVAIASLQLQTSDPNNSALYMQMNREGLELLIRVLRATLKELQTAEEQLSKP